MTADALRLDKWLWHARFCKSRSIAAEACTAGRIRINGSVVQKAHAAVKPGDVLTFTIGGVLRVIRVEALGTRRGPATEARTLYEEIETPIRMDRADPRGPSRPQGSGRPTKANRRAIDRLQEPAGGE